MDNQRFISGTNLWQSVLFGGIVGAITTAAMLFLMAFVLTLRDFSVASAAVFSCIALGSGGLVGGFAASKKLGSKGMVAGSLTGTGIYLLILTVSMMVNDSGFTAFSLIKAVVVIVSGAIGGVGGVNIRKKQKYV